MRKIVRYVIHPLIPERLRPLSELAYNLWWAWHPDAIKLWRRVDSKLWQDTNNNPVKMLGLISQSRLDQLSEDDGFLTHLDRVIHEYTNYMESSLWFQKSYKGKDDDICIAYFSAEFGITESIPIYSGGLGILAGDHLKSASDLGLPLVGVGLLYSQGYFQQHLNRDGWQQEVYPENDFYNMPLFAEKDKDGSEIKIQVEYPGRIVTAKVWRVQCGRIPLVLLDTNLSENSAEDRTITHQLYGGDINMRIEQEILLGIGGVMALQALGIKPDVYHMNEGHSAFSALERIRKLMNNENLSFDEACEEVTTSSVFTTHTPVPAGNDTFSPQIVNKYFSGFQGSLGLSEKAFLGLGRQDVQNDRENFCMTVLAIKLSAFTNGVSKLHSEESKKMWKEIYKGLDVHDVPIRSITNGIHVRSWISDDLSGLYDQYLGARWVQEPANDRVWEHIDEIPNSELWRSHEKRRERLVGFTRVFLKQQIKKRGCSSDEVRRADEVLRPDAMTIGFARRFATYKRGNLLFHDLDRLKKILTNKKYPVQVVIAGKAHPRDHEGKTLIKNIIHWVRNEGFRNHVVFLENYDINLARQMVQGVDVWLNTPRRPLEASGTSGMKAAANGALNLSILDGWWCEGYTPQTGWAIGNGEVASEYLDGEKEQDDRDSMSLYDLLEKEIVPLYYDRSHDGTPHKWISMMKSSMSKLNAVFNTNRMVRNYTVFSYIPCATHLKDLKENDRDRLKQLSKWKTETSSQWSNVSIDEVKHSTIDDLKVGQVLDVNARLSLGELKPEDVQVEIYFGPLNVRDNMQAGSGVPMKHKSSENGNHVFCGSIPLTDSGHHGFSIRAVPSNPDLFDRICSGMVVWNENEKD